MRGRNASSRRTVATWKQIGSIAWLTVAILGIASLCVRPLAAQVVITEDTVITETVPGFNIGGPVTVRIAPGGRVEGDITTSGLERTATLILDGGTLHGSIGKFSELHVIVRSGVITGSVQVLESTVDVSGGVVLGSIYGLTAAISMNGGFVAGGVGTDYGLYVSGGSADGFVSGGFGEISGGHFTGGFDFTDQLSPGPVSISGIDIELSDGLLRGRLLDGSDLGGGVPIAVEDRPLEIDNHPNALYLVPSSTIVGSCTGVDVSVMLASDCDGEGLSFGLAHDGVQLAVLSVEPGEALASLRGGAGPEYWEIDTDPLAAAGLTVAAIGSLLDPLSARVPKGPATEIVKVKYDVLDDAPIGLPTARIELSNELRPAPNTEAVEGVLSCQGARVALAGSGISLSLAPCFERADANSDGHFDVSDPITVLLWLFAADKLPGAPGCLDALDTDDNGAIEMTDAVLALGRLFTGGVEPAPPFGECGVDPTYDGILCDAPACP